LRRELLLVLGLAPLSALVIDACHRQWRAGAAQVFGTSFSARRDSAPLRFWLALGSWALVATLVGIRAAQGALHVVTGTPSPPASGRELLMFGLVLASLGLVAVVRLKLWRRGNPLLHWRELRREAELRARIRALVDDPGATYEGETIDEFAAFAELEWLEEIAAHLARQPMPRDLGRAIEETDVVRDVGPVG